jgi:cytochrome c-type biogenesis protein CcmH/NrfG
VEENQMDAKTIFTFAGGVVVGLILGVLIFSGGPSTSSRPAGQQAQPQPQPQVNKIALQREIAQLEGIVKSDPQNYQAWKKLGDNYFDTELFQKSVDSYRKALAIDDRSPDVWTDMGVMYRRLGDFTKALESFDEAIKRGPNHTVSRLNKGVVYINDLNDLEKGIAAWEDFLRVEPTGQRADQIRGQLEQIRASMGGPAGPIPTDTELPPDHPPLEGQGGAPAPANPEGYFPKPGQQ